MLGGQNLRGCHQGALVAVLHHRVQQSGSHGGFAAAHIPLQQSVHGIAALQVGNALGHCPALGAGQGKGQTGRKGCGAVFFNDPSGGGALAPLKFFQSDSQGQQFFKNQSVPGRFQRFCI